ncbi:Asparagine synthetase (glutamine-hydrolyzing) [Candidatus Hydrogenisulfobacillus filiaventi]|uniref:asparagine synthase (glutamine-hydrolyzing) n=1 Tax=Candidatus Hydrogenisulfobacillus filiaventi TaxID=2707344 RepID=A0A6F8ZJ48_9FIRM|nr:Asparagine synthetase (glutamine-hydrolyzing) [Candidatus Hydrogenisulfobacillus filiaventi]
MCGIAGVWRPGEPPGRGELRGMLDSLAHRGPDDVGHFGEGPLALGMRRLAILDVAGGRQPYRSEDGSVVAVFNGEIYNHRSLAELVRARGHVLASRADGEVLVHLYELFGPAFVGRLTGMFALALYDRRRRRLLLARDPVGQKPLYVWEDGGSLAFASEIKAFFALRNFRAEPDLQHLPAYLAHRFVPGPHTLLKGVRKVLPGEAWLVEAGHTRRWRYWTPELAALESGGDLAYWADRLEATLLDVVDSHLDSEVPMGLFLSGGLDSSLLAALVGRTRGLKPEAWSAAFSPQYPGYDESGWASRVGQALGLEVHRVEVDPLITPERVRDLAYILDEPMADPTALSLDGVARAAAERHTVMISGEGADEIFAGYAGYGEVASLAALRRIPAPLRRWWAGRGWPGAGAFRRAEEPVAARYRGVGFTFTPAEAQAVLHPDLAGPDRPPEVAAYWTRNDSLPDLQQMQGFDVGWFLPDDVLLKTDRIGMAYNLEIRAPYCDRRVVELALALPLALRRSRAGDKRVLRWVATRYLPRAVVARRKQGFPTPLTRFLEGPLSELAWDVLTGGRAQARGWFRPRAVEALLTAPPSSNTARKIYALLMLELWTEELVEGGRRRLGAAQASSPLWLMPLAGGTETESGESGS